MKFLKSDKISKYGWLLDIVAVFFITALVLIAAYFSFDYYYRDKIYPGIKIGDINMGGVSKPEATKILSLEINKINQNGIVFTYQNKETAIMPITASLNNEAAQQLIIFDASQDIETAFLIGRGDNFFINLINKLSLLIFQKNLPISYELYKPGAEQILRLNYSEYELPAQNARLKIEVSENENISVLINDESMGKIINYEKALSELEFNIAFLKNTPINLSSISDYPEVSKKDCLNIETQVKNALTHAPLILKNEEKKWEINKAVLADWLVLKKNNSGVFIGLDEKQVIDYLSSEISPEIETEPIDAKFEIIDGKVTEFQASQDGKIIDKEKTFLQIENEFINNRNNELELIINNNESGIGMEDVNELGIREIIGTGYSNFAGSPANRIHNIKVGAETLNGSLIKPDEEFSLVKILGDVNAEKGYKQELVIKGNRTIPEYGGGLCQVATTLFRSAIQSGLPITARRNHAYRVSYYEPAGTDAAVYIPWPDVKFINNTGNYILIQARIENKDIYFDFWGTKDGRVTEVGDPVIYNIVKPGPTKIIESSDLAPGQKKCTEKAHNGADAYFDYKVTYSDGEIKDERFKSHYVPWREVCLIGVEEKKEEIGEEGSDKLIDVEVPDANTEASDAEKNNDIGQTSEETAATP